MKKQNNKKALFSLKVHRLNKTNCCVVKMLSLIFIKTKNKITLKSQPMQDAKLYINILEL